MVCTDWLQGDDVAWAVLTGWSWLTNSQQRILATDLMTDGAGVSPSSILLLRRGKGTARRELAGVGRDGVSGHCGAPACGGGGREAHGELISGVHGVEKGLDAAAAARSRAWRW